MMKKTKKRIIYLVVSFLAIVTTYISYDVYRCHKLSTQLRELLKPTTKIVYTTSIDEKGVKMEKVKVVATVEDQAEINEIMAGIFIKDNDTMMKCKIPFNAILYDADNNRIGNIGCGGGFIRPAVKGFPSYDYPLVYSGKFEFRNDSKKL